jgi:acyl dehydratase
MTVQKDLTRCGERPHAGAVGSPREAQEGFGAVVSPSENGYVVRSRICVASGEPDMQPHWFEDLREGAEFTTDAHLVRAEEIDAFSALTGDQNPLHLDDEYARAAGFEGRIAHGVLGLALATGLLNRLGLTRGTLVALLGVTWDFRRALRPGDRIELRVRVVEARRTRRKGQGFVKLAARLCLPDGESAQEGEWKMLVRQRGDG